MENLLGGPSVEGVGGEAVLALQESETRLGHDEVVILFHRANGAVALNN